MALAVSLGSYAMASRFLASSHESQRSVAARQIVERFEADAVVIDRLLAAAGASAHTEPVELSEALSARANMRVFYSGFEALREAAVAAGIDPQGHLVHRNPNGYFVPVDLPAPLVDPEGALWGEILGSSQGLMRELIALAPALGIPLRDGVLEDAEAEAIEAAAASDEGAAPAQRHAWLVLYEAARLSLEHGLAIVFS